MSKNELARRSGFPRGIPYIIGNELAERFSYYGMKAILTVFMTTYLMNSTGEVEPMEDKEAEFWFHIFGMTTYAFPVLGAIIADAVWGKYRTIIILSIVYCAGHVALAMDETRMGLSLGLTMIAIGSGGIKPCVSAHVGDQFSEGNKHLLNRIFSIFYISINVGAAISTLLTPWLLKAYGPWLAFGLPGLLMILATIIFWMGNKKFISVPPVGLKKYANQMFSKESVQVLLKLCGIFVFVAVFWSLFDQTGSSWINQAKSDLVIKTVFGIQLDPSQIQSANPILVLILVPIFAFVIYPYVNRFYRLTYMRKINIGMFIAGFSFAIVGWMQLQINDGETVSIGWQFLAYLILTIAEVMVSITALEFAYTQAPNFMKSLIMSLYLLSVSLGNGVTALVDLFIMNDDGTSKLDPANYFFFFAAFMGATAFLFILVARNYKEKTFIQVV